jgi:hypothetical protein
MMRGKGASLLLLVGLSLWLQDGAGQTSVSACAESNTNRTITLLTHDLCCCYRR